MNSLAIQQTKIMGISASCRHEVLTSHFGEEDLHHGGTSFQTGFLISLPGSHE